MTNNFIKRYENALVKHLVKVNSKEDLATWLIEKLTMAQLKDLLSDAGGDVENILPGD